MSHILVQYEANRGASENLLAVICNVLIVLAQLLMDNYLHWDRFPLVPSVHDLNAHLQVTSYLWVNKTVIYRYKLTCNNYCS